MLKKVLSLIFLVPVFFVDQIKTMEDPNLGSTSGSEERLALAMAVPSLVPDAKSISQVLSSLENNEIIALHCSSLGKMKEYEFLEITEKNLNGHKKMLCILGGLGININLLISAIYDAVEVQIKLYKQSKLEMDNSITLKDINVLLALLVKRTNINEFMSIEEFATQGDMNSLNKIAAYAFSEEGNSDLGMLLTRNNRLSSANNNIDFKQLVKMPSGLNFKTNTLLFKVASEIPKILHSSNKIPKELQSYCKWVALFPLLKIYFDCLEKLKDGWCVLHENQYGFKEAYKFKLTEENLNRCSELLYELLCIGVNIKPILFILYDYFHKSIQWIYSDYYNIDENNLVTLEVFNILLEMLVKRNAFGCDIVLEKFASNEEVKCLIKLVYYIFLGEYNDKVYKLLACNNLSPSLDCTISNKYNNNLSFLELLSFPQIPAEIVNFVIDNESKKNYDLTNLFRSKGYGILKCCLVPFGIDINKVKIFLKLMDKEIKMILNMKDDDGKTLLMHAVLRCDNEVVKLFLDQGADVTPVDNFGFTALDLAQIYSGRCTWKEKIDKYAQSIKLLKESRCNSNK